MKRRGIGERKRTRGSKSWIILVAIAAVVFLIVTLFSIRLFSSRDLDDVSPGRYCPESLIDKSDVLYVIPLLDNISIADNQSWCKYILGLNKTIAMHGVYHAPDLPGEFAIDRDKEYILKGIQEFEKCFGFYPSSFKSPQFRLSNNNAILLKALSLTVPSEFHPFFHKVYHCTDQEQKSYLVWTNRIADWI